MKPRGWGGRDEWMDGRKDEWMDGQIPPMFYRTSSSFGAAALHPLNLNHTLHKQGTGTADHLHPSGLFVRVHARFGEIFGCL